MGPATDTAPRLRRYADPYACPACSYRLRIDSERCSACGLLLQGLLARQLLQTLRTADNQLAQLVAASRRQAPPPQPPPAPTPAATPERRGLSEMTVPKLLLGLGALCLLVAAVIFLALTWSWLGVGGRTAVLAGLTLITGSLGVWLTRRDLRMAGEAMTTVALGLLALDVLGADSAGWLGPRSGAELAAVLGGVLLAAAIPLALTTRLVAPQLVGAAAVSLVGAGWLDASGHVSIVVTTVVLGYVALAATGKVCRLLPMVIAAALGAAYWWGGLLVYGFEEAVTHATLHELWRAGHGVPLLLASLMLLLPVAFARRHAATALTFTAAAAALLTVTACLPVADENATSVGVVALAALVGWTVASLVVPVTVRAVAWGPMLVAGIPVGLVTAGLGTQAVINTVGAQETFSRAATVHLHDPDPFAAPVLLLLGVAALLGAVGTVLPGRLPRLQLPAAVVLLAAAGTLALHPVPVWTIAGALVALGAALVAVGLRHEGELGIAEAVAGTAVVSCGLVVALPSAVLTAGVLAVLVVLAGTLHWKGWVGQEVWGGVLLPGALGGFVWAAGEVAGVAASQRGVPILVLLGLLAIARPRPEVAVSAVATGLLAAGFAVGLADDVSVALAVHLTVAGALVSAAALVDPRRRVLGWYGGALLAAATWVRLADVGVTAPEPYTLPVAVALLVVGWFRLRRDPAATTVRTLGPGLLLATVPSLLWVLADPVTLRAALLGVGCLALVLIGVGTRWTAPLVVGSAVGAAVVVTELAPYAAELPQWLLIGLAGTVLTLLGVTWEHRLRDVRAAQAYVGRLR